MGKSHQKNQNQGINLIDKFSEMENWHPNISKNH